MDQFKPVTAENMDAILKFLPIFEQADFSPGKWEGGETAENDPKVFTMSFFSFSKEARAFHQALYDNEWVLSFEWDLWQDEARQYFEPGALRQADLETLRKLLTLLVRKNRFCEGILAEAYESGLIVRILTRLKELRGFQV